MVYLCCFISFIIYPFLSHTTSHTLSQLFHRIGIMNLMDPMKPDRLYRLDLRKVDHREWVKILVTLAIAEPGENWEQVGEEVFVCVLVIVWIFVEPHMW